MGGALTALPSPERPQLPHFCVIVPISHLSAAFRPSAGVEGEAVSNDLLLLLF